MVPKLPPFTNSVDNIKHLFSLILTHAALQFLEKLIPYLFKFLIKAGTFKRIEYKLPINST